MNSNLVQKANNSKKANNGGLFNALTNAVSGVMNKATGAVKTATNAVSGSKNTPKSNSVTPVAPVTAGINAPVKGGAASVNYSVPPNQKQPSEAVMNWATTAGVPMPTASQMRNVAHGGKRSTKKRSTKKRKIHRRKSTHKRRSYGGKRHYSKTSRRSKTHHRK
jgi:hypothetical protein